MAEQSPLFRVAHPLSTVLTLVRTLLGSSMPVDIMLPLIPVPVPVSVLELTLVVVLPMTRRRVVLLLNVPWTPRETVTE